MPGDGAGAFPVLAYRALLTGRPLEHGLQPHSGQEPELRPLRGQKPGAGKDRPGPRVPDRPSGQAEEADLPAGTGTQRPRWCLSPAAPSADPSGAGVQRQPALRGEPRSLCPWSPGGCLSGAPGPVPLQPLPLPFWSPGRCALESRSLLPGAPAAALRPHGAGGIPVRPRGSGGARTGRAVLRCGPRGCAEPPPLKQTRAPRHASTPNAARKRPTASHTAWSRFTFPRSAWSRSTLPHTTWNRFTFPHCLEQIPHCMEQIPLPTLPGADLPHAHTRTIHRHTLSLLMNQQTSQSSDHHPALF